MFIYFYMKYNSPDISRGLQSMLTDISTSPSEAIISVGNNWDETRLPIHPSDDVDTMNFGNN